VLRYILENSDLGYTTPAQYFGPLLASGKPTFRHFNLGE
jgi:hypothetical protein